MVSSRELTALELFAGGGSVHLALKDANVRVVWANDFCPRKRATYSANFPETPLDPRSIADIEADELPQADILHASSPCQDHSVSGLRRGFAGERGSLAFQVPRLVGRMRDLGRAPRLVVVENVEGLLTHEKGADFAALATALYSQGYLVGALVIDAALFVPQTRRRLFLVAVQRGTDLPAHLIAREPTRRWHPTTLRNAVAALSPALRAAWQWWRLPEPPKRAVSLADIIENDSPKARWLDGSRLERLASRMRSQDKEALASAAARGERVGVTMRKRRPVNGECVRVQQVAFDGRTRCLTKGEGYEALQLIFPDAGPHGFRVRDLTPRERARLTGLPDSYILPATATGVRELTGDAVVVDAYRFLARHLLVQLARAPMVGVEFRHPERRRKDVRAGSTANRPVKRATTRLDLNLVPEARERLGELAARAGMPMREFLLAAVDRQLAARGEAPLPRYVAALSRRACGQRTQRKATQRGTGTKARLRNAATPMRYPGGKAKVASRLVRILQRSTCLVEPFAGSAAVGIHALLLRATDKLVLAERDDGVRPFWCLVAAGPQAEFDALLRTVEGAKPTQAWWRGFEEAVTAQSPPHLSAAKALLSTRFRWGGIHDAGLVSDAELQRHWRAATMVGRLQTIRALRRRITVMDDAMGAIAEFRDERGAAFFVDPPYSVAGGPGAKLYRHHELDHDALLACLKEVRGRVLATYDDRPEVRALAARHGFSVEPLPIRDAHRRKRTELLLSRGTGPP